MSVEQQTRRSSAERWTGRRLVRKEDPAMLTGAAAYVADLDLPDIAEAAFVRSPFAHARIRGIDASAARSAPGVIAIYTATDLADTVPTADTVMLPGAIKTPRAALPRDRARYAGEAVAVVVAEDRYLAEDAAERVVVDWESMEAANDVAAATKDGAPLVHEEVAGNCYYRDSFDSGATEMAFARASHVVTRRLHLQRMVSSAMEGRGILARVDPLTGELVCWISSQAPHQQRSDLAAVLGLPAHRVRVIVPSVGGSFGVKSFIHQEEICVAFAALRLARPVRWTEDRLEGLTAGPQAKEQQCEVALAADEDGRLLAMRGRFIGDTGAYSTTHVGGYIDFALSAAALPGPYAVPEVAYEVQGVLTNKPPISPYRGVGVTAAQIIREMLLDDLGRKAGIDRVELRARNLLDGDESVSATGQRYERASHRVTFERAIEMIGHSSFSGMRRQAAREGRMLGIGIAPFIEMAAPGARTGKQVGIPIASYDHATVTLELSGTITVAVPTQSHGQGHLTSFAQLTADIFGVAPDSIHVIDGDTSRTPWGMGSYGSRSAVVGGGAILRAGTSLRERVIRAASVLLELPVGEIELADGYARSISEPARAIPLAALAAATTFGPQVRSEIGDPSLSVTAFNDADATTSNGCTAAIVEVDPDLGSVAVNRLVVVEDCGTMLNPMIVEGQITGGAAQGIGLALLERCVHEAGQPRSTTFADYLVPRSTDVPKIEVGHVVTPSERSPHGVKGMAEGTAIAVPSAIINAVFDAIAPAGDHIDTLPLSAPTILAALERGQTVTDVSAAAN